METVKMSNDWNSWRKWDGEETKYYDDYNAKKNQAGI